MGWAFRCGPWQQQTVDRRRDHEGNGGHAEVLSANKKELSPSQVTAIFRQLTPFAWEAAELINKRRKEMTFL